VCVTGFKWQASEFGYFAVFYLAVLYLYVISGMVIIETHIEFCAQNIAVPYNRDYHYPPKNTEYFGPSAAAMLNLATKRLSARRRESLWV